MNIYIIGISLRMRNFQPILILKKESGVEQYSVEIDLKDAIQIASFFHGKEKGSIETISMVQRCVAERKKPIGTIAIVFSEEGSIIAQIKTSVLFRTKTYSIPLAEGIMLASFYGLNLVMKTGMLTRLEQTNAVELKRAFTSIVSGTEVKISDFSKGSEELLLHLEPETMLFM